jgi:hypothetical protein
VISEPRKPGRLSITPALAEALARLRQQHAVATPAELELDRVTEVEAAFGLRLPDDLLGVYAAAVPPLVDRHKLTIGSVIAHTGSLREHRARGDLVGLGQRGARTIMCVSLNKPGDLMLFDVDDRSCAAFDLLAWIDDLAADTAAATSPLVATLMAYRPESTLAGRRVRHKIFGDGRALSENGTGPLRKVTCDFPGRGLKVLQARFLEYLE